MNRVLILLSICIVWASAHNELNFGTKEDPESVIEISVEGVHIVGLTQNSLDRFTKLEHYFVISRFTIDDINTLNQSNLFAHHTSLKQISFLRYNGSEELNLHEELFSGLINLEKIGLVGLNLKTIPKRLFKNLVNLSSINLSDNKLKSLHRDVFSTNPMLSYTFLGENQFLDSGIPLDITLLHQRASISLLGTRIDNFETLVPIMMNPNITYINLGLCDLTNIKMNDFTQIPDRQVRMDMRLFEAEYTFNMDDLTKNGVQYELIPYSKFETILNNSRAYIEIEVTSNSDMCNNCRFIKDAFLVSLQDHKTLIVQLIDSKVLFSLDVGCEQMENHYTNEYQTNCPNDCKCQYNPFLDKIWIDCHGKNLTAVPTIPYPVQFDNITSISIDLSNNLLESFLISNIDGRVVAIITELDLSENIISSLVLESTVVPNLHQINLCKNAMLNDTADQLLVSIEGTIKHITTEQCSVGRAFPTNPMLYISNKPEAELQGILQNAVCH